jgi:catechol 2,3-dioxygenase-like lactoylglutathione lyase family enzyme
MAMQLTSAMFFVKDLNRMADFYTNTIGLRPVEETRLDNWVEFEAGGVKFSLHAIPLEIASQMTIAAPALPREKVPVKLSFKVPDIPAEVQRLRSAGVQIIERPWGGYEIVDPEGNILGLTA